MPTVETLRRNAAYAAVEKAANALAPPTPNIAHRAVEIGIIQPANRELAESQIAKTGAAVLAQRGTQFYVPLASLKKIRRSLTDRQIKTAETKVLMIEEAAWASAPELPYSFTALWPYWRVAEHNIVELQRIDPPDVIRTKRLIVPIHVPFNAPAEVEEIVGSWCDRVVIEPVTNPNLAPWHAVIEAGIKEKWGTEQYAYLVRFADR